MAELMHAPSGFSVTYKFGRKSVVGVVRDENGLTLGRFAEKAAGPGDAARIAEDALDIWLVPPVH